MSKTHLAITVETRKPRNPFVSASRFRQAGSHRPGGGAMRKQAQQDLQRELGRLRTHSP